MTGWLIMYQNQLKMPRAKPFQKKKNCILGLYDSVKKTLKSDLGNQKHTKDNTNLTTHENEGDGYIRVEMLFNSLMAKFFQGNDINDLI